jgi:hypothetical protein
MRLSSVPNDRVISSSRRRHAPWYPVVLLH